MSTTAIAFGSLLLGATLRLLEALQHTRFRDRWLTAWILIVAGVPGVLFFVYVRFFKFGPAILGIAINIAVGYGIAAAAVWVSRAARMLAAALARLARRSRPEAIPAPYAGTSIETPRS
jgi:hypothetical protein